VFTEPGERDASIAATEQRAGAALQAMITDESLMVSEAVRWCAGGNQPPEAARLRQLTAQAHTASPRMTAPGAPTFDDPAPGSLQARVEILGSCLHKLLRLRNAGLSQRANWRVRRVVRHRVGAGYVDGGDARAREA
jgi:hypothetical protein